MKLTGISSMATREVLAELAGLYEGKTGTGVAIESVGGVEAARRVRAGEPFDVVFLAAEAMGSLEFEGRVARGTVAAVATSGVAIAVHADAALPDISTEDAVRTMVLDAASIGYSTGPSGAHLLRMFEGWGIAEAIKARCVQAPPGVPVATLVASGQVQVGFQQLSELVHAPGIRVVGTLPREIQVTTTFSGGVNAASNQQEAARALLAYAASSEVDDVKRRHGMEPPA